MTLAARKQAIAGIARMGILAGLWAACAWSTVPAGFSKTAAFDDEFTGSTLDLTKWDYRYLGARGIAIDIQNAISVANGYLTVTTYSANDANGVLQTYTGMISTEKSFLQKYGYWESSVRFHYQPGMQTAFWVQSPTVGNPIGNPQAAGVELDIFEHVSRETNPIAYDHALVWDGYGCQRQIPGRQNKRSSISTMATSTLSASPGRPPVTPSMSTGKSIGP